VQVEDDEVVE